MPLTKISLRKGQNADYKQRLLYGVRSALVKAFSVPDSEIYQQILEFEANDFEIPLGKSSQFVIIEVIALQGRSFEAKKILYQTIVENLESLKIPGNDILIILVEPPADNWGLRGGKPASEVNLGFKVET